MSDVQPIPEGYHSLTPYLNVSSGNDALALYTTVFGATELFRMPGMNGEGVGHAEIQIGNSRLMLADECSEGKSPLTLGGSPVSLMLYIKDVDAVFEKATSNGFEIIMEPTDMFWGDRMARVVDPFGHNWSFATHIEDVPPEEMPKRQQEWIDAMSGDCV